MIRKEIMKKNKKKFEKSLGIVLIVSVVIILIVPFVSAGWFDWFKDLFKIGDDSDLEGELANIGILGRGVSNINQDWCEGTDINRDGKVDETDKEIISSNYNRGNCSEENNWCDNCDIDKDGRVSGSDLGIFSANFGKVDCGGECLLDCTDKECGDDGCGGSCGECGEDEKCENDVCITDINQDWCEGVDINRDGKVDEVDKDTLRSNYGKVDCSEDNNWCDECDINRDGKVSGRDLGILSANWERDDCDGEKDLDFEISIATLKDSYSVGEKIELTDPPDEDGDYLVPEDSIYDSKSDIVEEGIVQEEAPKSYGYIIQFEDKPVLEKKKELDEKAEKNEKKIKEDPILTTITGFRFFATRADDVPDKVKKYSKDLKKDNEKIKERVLSEIKEERAKITGDVVSELDKEIEVMNEFDKVFNGVALDVSDEEAEELENIEGVKAVYPNLEVHATLMDSVPLIGADDVWELDEDGNDCSVSGKECLTGEGVSIAILDTGVDYTHEDLG